VNQAKVSARLNYQLQGFSVERLMKFLTALDRDIEIVIHLNRGPARAANPRNRSIDPHRPNAGNAIPQARDCGSSISWNSIEICHPPLDFPSRDA
jgi:helix-turn-helix protein